MARAHFVKKARKDNPAVKKGESYWWWEFRYGGKHYSATRPRPSQLTQSPYYSALRRIIESVEDYSCYDYEDYESLVDEIKNEIIDLRDETHDSLDNMPDSLQYSPTGELLQERIDALDSVEAELDCVEEFEFDAAALENYPRLTGEEIDEQKAEAFQEWFSDAKSELIDAISNAEV